MRDRLVQEIPIGGGAFIVNPRASAPDRDAIRAKVHLVSREVWDSETGKRLVAKAKEEEGSRRKAAEELRSRVAAKRTVLRVRKLNLSK